MKKIFAGIMMLAAVAFTSCQEWLDVNKNIDTPDYVEATLYLSGIQQSMQGLYWDIRATGPITQYMGTSSYTTFASHRYTTGSDNGGEMWRMVYWNMGMNLENFINQSVEAEHWTLAGIGYAMKAFAWDAMTKYHGDLPLDDAFVEGLLEHDYDYQDYIYEKVKEWADTAIEYLTMEDSYPYGAKLTLNDWIYGGDKDKWIKFCYAVKIRQLSSLVQKPNFNTELALELVSYADKTFQSPADDATLSVEGGGQDAPASGYNNFWCPRRGNLSSSYWQHKYPVQVMTGTVPAYDENGNKILVDNHNDVDPRYKYVLAEKQIITDTNVMAEGHYDPRAVVKLATTSDPLFENTEDLDVIKRHEFYGGGLTSRASDVAGINAPYFYGREVTTNSSILDGIGRWIYREDAPYIMMTSAEVKFCIAEAYFRMGDKANALTWWKAAIADDMEFTAKYIYTGKAADNANSVSGGDKISKAVFNKAAAEYLAGPFVEGVTVDDLTLSHIMMQKFVALFPWGANETWVDQRKVFYDVNYTGDYPYNGNGWNRTQVDYKNDNDPTKVYQGFYLYPARVEGYKSSYSSTWNLEGAPCFRVPPRFNSEYMWNKPSLRQLKPISGMTPYYQCSIPWFCYPNGYPETYPDVDNSLER
ncbi:MAG: SusD/RagB family nutrient-binding outer membrane lipoprotein [Rikenellaceae bacterium]|nr:SusD/RagB family nutrient-binding outer membrane lipoprotein [Rikenellaceae bacterium]